MKIHVGMAHDYCPRWGLWEGIRELVQNWMDAFQEGDSIEHSGTSLVIWNRSGALETKDLALVGGGKKANDPTKRGQFGDGLKAGCLALVREGLEVRVRTGGAWWRAKIETNRDLHERVLTFRSRKDQKDEDGVFFRVDGITRSQWDSMRGKFIFKDRGRLLEEKPGQIYVHDIWACERADFAFGYNLPDARLGRDRDIVGDFDIRYAAGQILAEALRTGEVDPARVMGLLSEGCAEAEYVKSFLDEESRRKLEEAFETVHGDRSCPVHTDEQHRVAEHLGLKPVIVNRALVEAAPEILRKKMGEDPVLMAYEPTDLTHDEDLVLSWAIGLIGEGPLSIEVVKFVDEDQLGSRDGGTINLGRSVLQDRWKTVQTLVEELAHDAGGDGTFAHKWRIHEIYTNILRKEAR